MGSTGPAKKAAAEEVVDREVLPLINAKVSNQFPL
jgi:hypothetical protein